jgi:hypothetical protein
MQDDFFPLNLAHKLCDITFNLYIKCQTVSIRTETPRPDSANHMRSESSEILHVEC